jgi:putative SOS response-associated peptidase YedK
MCGRYYVEAEDTEELRDVIAEARAGAPQGSKLKTGEIFPSDIAPVIVGGDGGNTRALAMKWGFPRAGGGLIINARSETAHEKALFRDSARGRRCLIPASRYFEWRRLPAGKEKYAIRQAGAGAMYLAGLYMADRNAGGACFVILTRPAAESIAFIHDRMPVILPKERLGDWLSARPGMDALLKAALEEVEYMAV